MTGNEERVPYSPAVGKQRQVWVMPTWMLEVMPEPTWFHYSLLCWAANGSPVNLSLLTSLLSSLFSLPSFYLFSQADYLPFFFPLPASSTGNYVGIIQLPEHRHATQKTRPHKVLPRFVVHACELLLQCHCNLPPQWAESSRELEDAPFSTLSSCVCRVKTCPVFSPFISWSCLIIPSAQWFPHTGGNSHYLWIPICRDQRAERKGLLYRNQCLHQRSGEMIRQIICLNPSCPFCLEKMRKSYILSHIANNSPLTPDWAKIPVSTDLF